MANDDSTLVAQEESVEADAEGDETDLFRTRPYNRRIDLPLLDEDPDGPTKDNEDNGENDDELTRDKVKKASSQILNAQEKRLKKKTPKEKRATNDE